MKYTLACIVAVLTGINVSAKQYRFENYTQEDGLLGDSVTTMTQDGYGFIWIGTRNGVCRYDGNEFMHITGKGEKFLLTPSVCMMTDSRGRVWISSASSFGCIDTHTDVSTTVNESLESPVFSIVEDKEGNIWTVCGTSPQKITGESPDIRIYDAENMFPAFRCCATQSGDVWFSSTDGNIYRYVSETDSFKGTRVLSEDEVRSGLELRYIAYASNGRFLVSTNRNDLFLVNPSKESIEKLFSGSQDKRESIIIDIAEGPDSDYWMATDRGLHVFSQDGTHSIYMHHPADPESLSSDNVRSIFKDKNNHMWLGTYYSGINVYRPSEIEVFQPFSDTDDHSIAGNTVRAIYIDSEGDTWIGTEDGHLNLMDRDGGVTELGSESGLPSNGNYNSIIEYEGEIFISTFNRGIDILDKKTKTVRRHITLGDEHPVTLFKTSSDVLLIGTDKGLLKYDPAVGEALQQKEFGDFLIHSFCQDHLGNVWVGTFGKGVFLWDMDSQRPSRIRTHDNKNLSSVHITCLFEDSNGTMWAGTEGSGLIWVGAPDDSRKRDVGSITAADGLGSDITCAIVSDNHGNLWVSTSKGIYCIDPVRKEIIDRLYDNRKGAGRRNYFRYGAVCKDSSGIIYMGSAGGMIGFNPEGMSDSRSTDILFTDIMAAGKEGTKPIREGLRSAMETKKVRIAKKDASSIYISYSAIGSSYLRPLDYEHRLTRESKVLHESKSSKGDVTLTGLQPGHYTFSVKLSDQKESIKPAELRIIITPPFYESKVALLFYVLLLLSLIRVYFSEVKKKRDHETAISAERMEADKRKEIYEAKINFFTNITHEIRTPLTLIKMPLEKILDNKEYVPEAKQDLLTIKANTDRLLDLSNQLLDLRKIEAKEMKLNFLMEDVCSITRDVCECFSSVTKERHITFDIFIPDKPVMAMCASASVNKIITNLVSNAVKYCRTYVSVSLMEGDDDSVVIKVYSDSTPIRGNSRERVFDAFYQEGNALTSNITGSSGTGLGLPFAKTLAELHGGSIILEDEEQSGNTFTFHLPKSHDDAIIIHESGAQETDEPDDELMEDNIARMHSILIVEDDMALNDYIRKELSDEYRVHQAINGEDAIQKLKETKIDLVISDIMMPVMDGRKLCNFIKNNLEYSHIPVILMTAVVGMDTRIETLNVGADAYIEKPFSMSLLKANVASLFMNREITFKQFTESPLSHFNGLKINNIDDEYMSSLHSAVMEHMSESDFSVEKLIQILKTSKSTMFRKVKANTGMNINEFIRVCRLKKAAELLATRSYRINEVSYMVGYSSPSYFASMFQKQFNISPSDFLKNKREESE